MRKALIILAGMALIAVAIGGSLASASTGKHDYLVIKTLEVNKTDELIDVAPTGESIGDEQVIWAKLVDPNTLERLGFTQAVCVEIRVEPFSLECYGTMHLEGGVVDVAGSFLGGVSVNKWGITGGTGKFQLARGYMTLPFAPNGNLFHNLYIVMS